MIQINQNDSNTMLSRKVEFVFPTPEERQKIYRLRHAVYATELNQHVENQEGYLCDGLDDFNVYIAAKLNDEIIGFISITPPDKQQYSIDKYFSRDDLAFRFDDKLYEVRLLTVVGRHRGNRVASLLMYAAFRWIEEAGGEQIIAIGRSEILDLYLKVGLRSLGLRVKSGEVSFELLHGEVNKMRSSLSRYEKELLKIENRVGWHLHIPFIKKHGCFHGGVFFQAIGEEFDHLEKSREIINADVLDAWFPPSPKVIAVLQEYFSWLLRTSPPVNCSGMEKVIARVRNVSQECILAGAGSSDLLFLAFRQWLNPKSKVLILDPTYGEYSYICEQVIGCRLDRINLLRSNGYVVDLSKLEISSRNNYDLIVLVNPNNPTGRHIPKQQIENVLRYIPEQTLIWIDEAYVDYVGTDQSLEVISSKSKNIIVSKSMSKCYALSGMRAAYLCGPASIIDELRKITPPWAVSLPAQVAAVMAIQDQEYYAQRCKETNILREELAKELHEICGLEVTSGAANFLLCHLPSKAPKKAEFIKGCSERGLFIRDISSMGINIDLHAFRIAVKDRETNKRMIETIACVVTQEHKPKGG